MSDLAALERERRERLRRERERARAQRTVVTPRTQRRATTGPASSAVATEEHEGLIPLLVRLTLATPLAVARFGAGVGRELGAMVGGALRPALRAVSRSASTGHASSTVAAPRVQRQQPVLTPAQLRARARRRALLVRRLRGAALVLGVVLAVLAWRVVPASDLFSIRQIEVSGTSSVSDLDVRIRIDELVRDETIYTIDVDAISERIERLPFVRSVSVDRHFPGGLTIRVVEHRPLALGFETRAKRWWLIAPDGRVLAPSSEREWRDRLPLVRLASTRRVRAGMHLDQEPAIRVLRAVPDSTTMAVRAVRVLPYSVTMDIQDGIEIRLGRPLQLRTKIAAAERFLAIAQRKRIELAYIDVAVPGYTVICAVDDACAAMPAPDERGSGDRARMQAGTGAGVEAQTFSGDIAATASDADDAAAADDGATTATAPRGVQGPSQSALAAATGEQKAPVPDAFDTALARSQAPSAAR